MNSKGNIYRMALTALTTVILAMSAGNAWAQQTVDSVAVAIRVKTLESRRASLKAQIKEEDQKRKRVVEGITPEANERLNTVQDSICLELRSQLVSVELELGEVAPTSKQDVWTNLHNALKPSQQKPAATKDEQ